MVQLGDKKQPAALPVNDFAGEGSVSIPTDPNPSTLNLKFNVKAYRLIEKMTGVSHFERSNKRAYDVQSLDFLVAALFAGSRKNHPDYTLEAITEAVEDLDNQQVTALGKATVEIFEASIFGTSNVKLIKDMLEAQKKKLVGEGPLETTVTQGYMTTMPVVEITPTGTPSINGSISSGAPSEPVSVEGFYEASYFEVVTVIEAYYKRLEDNRDVLAWQLSYIISALTGDYISPARLTGRVIRSEVPHE